MILRGRQETFVSRAIEALLERRNTLGVAPTGAGKTVQMAAIAQELPKKAKLELPSLVIQHRDELVSQNSQTFRRYIGKTCQPRIINADKKVWDRSKSGYNFAMIQTISRESNLKSIPPMGALYIDEAHHAAAPTYLRVVDHLKKLNPDLHVFGTTATPNRGDNKGLIGIFDNCCDQILISELINSGHLVRPVPYVIDVGTQTQLMNVPKTARDFDMQKVSQIMNKKVINDEVVKHWLGFVDKKTGGDKYISCADRPTIVFCSNLEHAYSVSKAFNDNDITSAVIDGSMGKRERKATLKAYDKGEIRVLVNCAVLTEGFDHQPTSCVILLRPSSWKSTMTQMIGRGLRTVDPEKYPGVEKDDCIILDFGTSLLQHGNLTDEADLHGAGVKDCKVCKAVVPEQSKECPICGFEFPHEEADPSEKAEKTGDEEEVLISNVSLTQINILDDSPFKYEVMFGGNVRMCSAFTAWACIVNYSNGRTYALGGRKEEESNRKHIKMLADTDDPVVALQKADDWMREYGDKKAARKSKRWLTQSPSEKQIKLLERMTKTKIGHGTRMGMTKYHAVCRLEWEFNWKSIKSRVLKVSGQEKQDD